ncbi:hypothetical protein BD779DRAFT_1672748 [Infundibulicybe gibba]|nr:hypothetical protein BD779DRAFT_1672748 [Infundibulicybe gibba]
MAAITRPAPRLSVIFPETEKQRVRTRPSYTKHIERQLVQAWKVVTRVTRKQQRASIMPRDFVLITSRRRSALLA